MMALLDSPSVRCFSLPEVGEMLEALKLELLGFEHATPGVLQLYGDRFPEDFAALRLDYWQKFEDEFPTIFARGYVVWVARAEG